MPTACSTGRQNPKCQQPVRLKISQISERMRLIKTINSWLKNEAINRLESAVFAYFRWCDNATWWQVVRLSGEQADSPEASHP